MVQNGDLGKVLYYDSTRINLGLFQRDVNVIADLAARGVAIKVITGDNLAVALHVAQAVVRLKCGRCGEMPAAVTLADGHEGDGRDARQKIELLP